MSPHGSDKRIAGSAAPRGTGTALWQLLLTILLAHSAAVQPVHAEFLVNTSALGDQQHPVIAGNAAGETVVVWLSIPPSSLFQAGLFGQRYDSTGARVGGEFQVNIMSGYPSGYGVAMAASGNFVVAWDRLYADGSGTGVLARLYDSTGTALTGELPVNTYTAGYQQQPQVAMDSAGNFVVVWVSSDQDGSGKGVFGQRFDSTAAPVGAEFQVNTSTTGDQSLCGVASAPGGGFVVVWIDGGPFTDGLRGQRFDSAGMPVGTEFQVSTSNKGFAGVSVATDPGGGFIVVWSRMTEDSVSWQYDIRAQRYGSDGSALGTEFVISPLSSVNLPAQPSVAIDGTGNFVVFWSTMFQDGGPYKWWTCFALLGCWWSDLGSQGVVGQRFDASGSPLGPIFQVNTFTLGNQYVPVVATDASGNMFAAWTSSFCPAAPGNCVTGQDGDGNAVVGQRFVLATPSCPTVPMPTCREAQQSRLALSKAFGRTALRWSWEKGAQTLSPGDLGNPAAGLDGYAFCTYLDTGSGPALAVSAAIPAGGTCGDKPCWKTIGQTMGRRRHGFIYSDPAAVAGGISKVRLRAGRDGHAAVRVRGQGANLSLPALPIVGYVTANVQLINGAGDCWGAVYSAPPLRNSAKLLRVGF